MERSSLRQKPERCLYLKVVFFVCVFLHFPTAKIFFIRKMEIIQLEYIIIQEACASKKQVGKLPYLLWVAFLCIKIAVIARK